MPDINIPIYSPTLSYSHLFSLFLVVTISQIIYIVQVISLSASVFFYLLEKAVNGGKIITITHIIEPSL